MKAVEEGGRSRAEETRAGTVGRAARGAGRFSGDLAPDGSRVGRLLRSWAKLQIISMLVWEAEAMLVVFSRIRLDDVMSGQHRPLWRMIEVATLNFQVAAVLVPFVVALAVVADFGKGRRLSSSVAHIAGYAGFVALHAVMRAHVLPTHNWIGVPENAQHMSWVFFLAFLNDDVFVYVPTVILTIGYRYYRQLREREVADERTRTELALAQLQILKMQLQPHFLFNTLHAISTLTTRDPRRARKMISLLSDLLRIAIDYGTTQEVALKEEIDFIRKYLEIQQVRFEEALQVRLDIPSDTLDALVPNLVLQPVVENAVKHGVCMLESGGWVAVEAERRNGSLVLRISDNGPGVAESGGGEAGLGLRLTRARLERLYGSGDRLRIENPPSGGARVSITIPYHTET